MLVVVWLRIFVNMGVFDDMVDEIVLLVFVDEEWLGDEMVVK